MACTELVNRRSRVRVPSPAYEETPANKGFPHTERCVRHATRVTTQSPKTIRNLVFVLVIGLAGMLWATIPATANAHTVTRKQCRQVALKRAHGHYPRFRYITRACYRHTARHALMHRWRGVARCESGLRWRYNGASGFDGGLQFHPRTWSAFRRGVTRKRFAWQASPHVQRLVAERVRRRPG